MFNSIQYFEGEGIKNLRKAEDNFIAQSYVVSFRTNLNLT